MGTHAVHQPNTEHQILKDGCSECEERSKDLLSFLEHSDNHTFARACGRAVAQWEGDLRDQSANEARLYQVLGPLVIRIQEVGL